MLLAHREISGAQGALPQHGHLNDLGGGKLESARESSIDAEMVGTGGARTRCLGIALAFAFLMTAAAAWAGIAEVRPSAARQRPTPQLRGRGADASKPGRLLLGDNSVESSIGREAAGKIELFRFLGKRTGIATSITVFVASRGTAKKLKVGLYSSKNRSPSSFLSAGSMSFPKARRWNTISIRSTPVHSGRSYWVAVLAERGSAFFRDRRNGACVGLRSSVIHLAALPSRVLKVVRLHACPISAYASGTAGLASGQPGSPSKAPNSPSPGGQGPDGQPAILTPRSIAGTSRQGNSASAVSNTVGRVTPAPANVVVSQSCTVSPSSVTIGGSAHAQATLENTGGTSITLPEVIVAGRPPGGTDGGGPFDDFSPTRTSVVLNPGASFTIKASQSLLSASPAGDWYCFVTYETSDGTWHDDPHDTTFTVKATGGVGPTVSVVTTSSLTSTSATFTATINPNGADTTVDFEYGTTTSYGSTTPSQDIGSGTTPHTVTANVTGLTPGTTYHVRAVAAQ